MNGAALQDLTEDQRAEAEQASHDLAPFEAHFKATVELMEDALPKPRLYSKGLHAAFSVLISTLMKELVDAKDSARLLAERVDEIESRPSLEYSGVWDAAKSYRSGIFVTDGGSMWFAKRASIGVRPHGGDDWQLAVKRGRDGK